MRIQSLDILRGIAILGILFMNIYFHGSIIIGYAELSPKPLSDSVIEVINTLFFDGRFRTLFCILFGVGLAIQYDSCKKKNVSAELFLKSRLNWLILFGAIHAVFIFGGDILVLYSVCALTIIKTLQLPLKNVYQTSYKFLSIGILLSLLLVLVLLVINDDPPILRASSEYTEMYELWFNSYGTQVACQTGIMLGLVITSPLIIYWQITGLMLLGVFLYRTKFFSKGFSAKPFKQVFIAAVFFTCLDILLLLTVNLSDEIASVLASISAIFVALLYAHCVVRLLKNKKKFVTVFSAPGKIAFSLYIFQSIVMAIVLRYIFPALHLTAQRIDYVVIAIVLTILQVALAHFYLRYFSQGPLEYLWRSAYQRNVNKHTKKQIDHPKQ
jgi:uncharacterized protein